MHIPLTQVKREQGLIELETLLKTPGQFTANFAQVWRWKDITQEKRNIISIADGQTFYSNVNNEDRATVSVEVYAAIWGKDQREASILANQFEEELIIALRESNNLSGAVAAIQIEMSDRDVNDRCCSLLITLNLIYRYDNEL